LADHSTLSTFFPKTLRRLTSARGNPLSRKTLNGIWHKAAKSSLDDKDGITAVVRTTHPLDNWDSLRGAPSGRAEDELRCALQIAPAVYDHPLVSLCLKRSLDVVNAAERDQRWNTWWAPVRDVEHGRLLSIGLLARAWLYDTEIDATALVQAGIEILRGALGERPSWTELAQCEYLDGIQLLIIARRLNEAQGKLQMRRKFRRIETHYAWNADLIRLLLDDYKDGKSLKQHFDLYFDQIRNPSFEASQTNLHVGTIFGVPFLRLRLALIRWIYIERQPVAGNWRNIIAQIGY